MIPRSPSSANTDVGRAVLDQPTEGERLLARIRSRVVPLQQIDRDSDIFSIFGGPRLRVLSSTARLFRELPYPEGDDIPRVKISPLIQAAETELSTLTPEKILNEIQSSAKDPTDFLKPFLAAIGKEIESANARNKELQASQEDLNKTIVSQAKTAEQVATRQQEFNKSSFIAVYAMLGIVFMVFVSLRLFPAEIVHKILDTRTMLEVVSMAFLLLVILILGNGGLLKEDILGTLLGTVAGYIFGQKASQRPAPSTNPPPTNPPPQ